MASLTDTHSPLLFIISEPVGSSAANDVAARLGEHGVRSWIGSLAPHGALDDRAMDALRGSTAALLLFDAAAACSRHVDRHLLVARQTGVPLIPLRMEHADESLLRQELLDAQWVDGSGPDAGTAEIVSRTHHLYASPPKRAEEIGVRGGVPGRERPAALHADRNDGSGTSGKVSVATWLALLAVIVAVGALVYVVRSIGEPKEADLVAANKVGAAEPTVPVRPPSRSASLPRATEPLPIHEARSADKGQRRVDSELSDDASPQEEPRPLGLLADGNDADAFRTVSHFYAALGRGDGYTAAELVILAKRESGPLSGTALSRFYSSLRRPLHVSDVQVLGDGTVSVAYDYVLASGRLCRGRAIVQVTGPGDGNLISGIRTAGPC